jgi:hypothetical protein
LPSDTGSNFGAQTSNTTYYRPGGSISQGREVVFAVSQNVVMGTHPNIPNLIIIGKLGTDLPEEFVASALSHEEIHNSLNKFGESEKVASISFLDQIGSAVTELEATGLASEKAIESRIEQFRVRKRLNRITV